MKNSLKRFRMLAVIAAVTISSSAMAQQEMQYFRYNDQTGVNVFETTKNDSTPFSKMKVKVGGSFEMDFQALRDQNTAISQTKTGFTGNVNSLIPLTDGIDLPMANLNIDAQLADGIRVNLTAYLASRHHEDTWVKGGYVQFDKLLFLKSDLINNIMKSVTIKVGQFDVDYGDQHYRRSDGGSSIYNPFIENYIMDEFATETGGEIYFHPKNSGLIAMFGMTNGELDPTVIAATKVDSATHKPNYYAPAFHGKLGYDKQVCKDFRVRITGSVYSDQSGNSNTLFGGDRTGSHYFLVMSNQAIANGTTLNDANDYNPFSGRYNPGFSEEVNTAMGNLFLKYKGLEFFGTYEVANGRTITESSNRQATQYAADLIYRFTEKQNFWVGARYNSVAAIMQADPSTITISRFAASAGWFLTKNIMAKVEYVVQTYGNFPDTNILSGGEFKGEMVEAAIGF